MRPWKIGLGMCCIVFAAVIVFVAVIPNFRMYKGSTITLIGPKTTRTVTVEFARTPQERERGLMGRTSLPEDHGMLFVFAGEASPQHFWMKNTLIPLDIIFFAAEGSVVSTASMTPCGADPCPLYSSGGPINYALEVPAGFLARHGIDRRWRLDVSRREW